MKYLLYACVTMVIDLYKQIKLFIGFIFMTGKGMDLPKLAFLLCTSMM